MISFKMVTFFWWISVGTEYRSPALLHQTKVLLYTADPYSQTVRPQKHYKMKIKTEREPFHGHIWKCKLWSLKTNKTPLLAQFKVSDTWFPHDMTQWKLQTFSLTHDCNQQWVTNGNTLTPQFQLNWVDMIIYVVQINVSAKWKSVVAWH